MSAVIGWMLAHAEIVAPELGMLAIVGMLSAIPRTRRLAHRAIRTGKRLATSRDLPVWARAGFLLATLPIPGPFDEIVGGLLAVALMRGRHAATVRAAWRETA